MDRTALYYLLRHWLGTGALLNIFLTMSDDELKRIVMSFRVSDLVVLLGFAGRNKCGKKNVLQKRALDLITEPSSSVEMKIRELQDLRSNRNGDQQNIPERIEPRGLPLGDANQPSTSSNSNGSCSNSTTNTANVNGKRTLHEYFPTIHEKKVNPLPSNGVLHPCDTNPDVKFKDLAFFDNLEELLKPSTLIPVYGQHFQESDFYFCFNNHQVQELKGDVDVRVQLRFCRLDKTYEQDDNFPDNICVKVNKLKATLPNPVPTNKTGTRHKRPSQPIDITPICKLCSIAKNEVHVSWESSRKPTHALSVFLVRRLTSAILIDRLRSNGVRNADYTTAMIKEKLNEDQTSEIATTSLRGSLTCPLGKIKMSLPCRALTCSHLQCFDAQLYIQMNEKKQKWICPVCDKPALYQHLRVDGLFLDIATKLPNDDTEVQFYDDGSWRPMNCTAKVEDVDESEIEIEEIKEVKKIKHEPVDVVNLDSESEVEDPGPLARFHGSPPSPKRLCHGLMTNSQNSEKPTTSMTASQNSWKPTTSKTALVFKSITEPPNFCRLRLPNTTCEPSTSTGITHNGVIPKLEVLTDVELEASQPAGTRECLSPISTAATDFSAGSLIAVAGSDDGSTLNEFDFTSLLHQNLNDVAHSPSNEEASPGPSTASLIVSSEDRDSE